MYFTFEISWWCHQVYNKVLAFTPQNISSAVIFVEYIVSCTVYKPNECNHLPICTLFSRTYEDGLLNPTNTLSGNFRPRFMSMAKRGPGPWAKTFLFILFCLFVAEHSVSRLENTDIAHVASSPIGWDLAKPKKRALVPVSI